MNFSTMIKTFQLSILLLLLGFTSSAIATDYRLFVGEIKTLVLKTPIQRVAVGSGGLISTSILENGNLLILGESAGDTELQIWFKNGSVVAHKFYIIAGNSSRDTGEIKRILGNLPDAVISEVGKSIVIKGNVSTQQFEMIDKLIAIYPQILNLTQATSTQELEAMFTGLPGVTVSRAGSKILLRGEVVAEDKAFIEAVVQAYPDLIDLTLAPETINKPMVYMNVQITEFSTNAIENLGINWSNTFNGPSGGFAQDFTRSRGGSISDNNSSDFSLPGAATLGELSQGVGFFGIATSITSAINLAVSSGDAIILASPTLSTRSGTSAEFLSGGEFPIPVPDGNGGTTIEFKQYGVSLNVTPEIGRDGKIAAKVETEVSSIDSSVAVDGGPPGTRSRKTMAEVSLRQGQTLAISGLVNQEMGKDNTKIAGLGDIPILGALFRSSNFRNQRSDLIIFITPYAYDADSDLNKEALATEQSLRKRFFDNIDGEKNGLTEILD
ncbi:type II and III secretion system protein family protein [Shewanella psychromarinicola]|uniref:type II and III secretion system protein family protein n=1 Tax=Shewanella psychromarinicola TaxID=2487742 RepID=UPI003F4BF33B